jgi:hypothetical protein
LNQISSGSHEFDIIPVQAECPQKISEVLKWEKAEGLDKNAPASEEKPDGLGLRWQSRPCGKGRSFFTSVNLRFNLRISRLHLFRRGKLR